MAWTTGLGGVTEGPIVRGGIKRCLGVGLKIEDWRRILSESWGQRTVGRRGCIYRNLKENRVQKVGTSWSERCERVASQVIHKVRKRGGKYRERQKGNEKADEDPVRKLGQVGGSDGAVFTRKDSWGERSQQDFPA